MKTNKIWIYLFSIFRKSENNLLKRMFIYIFKRHVNIEGALNKDVLLLTANIFCPADNSKKLLVSSPANSSFVPVDVARK